MKLNMYAVVRLKDGHEATILEIFNGGEAYLADVVIREANANADPIEYGKYETRTIHPSDILSVFERVEKPYVTV